MGESYLDESFPGTGGLVVVIDEDEPHQSDQLDVVDICAQLDSVVACAPKSTPRTRIRLTEEEKAEANRAHQKCFYEKQRETKENQPRIPPRQVKM